MTTDNTKRDLWKEVQRKRKEKEEREWKLRHSVEQLKEDYPDLIPPSRYDKIFISQIDETEFIVDDEEKENYFEIYVLEPDIEGVRFDEIYYEDDIYHDEIGVLYVNDYSIMIRSSILEKVRNDKWINFSQENRDWLVKQDEILTTIKEESKREIPIQYREIKGEGQKSPSGKGQIFVSMIEESREEDDPYQVLYQRFIVDDENFHNHFSIWKQEGNIEFDLHKYGSEYYDHTGLWRESRIKDIYTSGTHKEITRTIDEWGDILDLLGSLNQWVLNKENREWLERQKELLTSVNTEIERERERVSKLNGEFRNELYKRKDNDDKSVLEYYSLKRELGDWKQKVFVKYGIDGFKDLPELPDRTLPDVGLPEYDGLSFEDILEQMIDEIRKLIDTHKEYLKQKETEKPTPEQDS